jgi:hypothetical protein
MLQPSEHCDIHYEIALFVAVICGGCASYPSRKNPASQFTVVETRLLLKIAASSTLALNNIRCNDRWIFMPGREASRY